MNRLTLLFFPALLLAIPPTERMNQAEAQQCLNDWYDAGNTHCFASGTGSMRPYIHGGEILLLERYTGQPLEVGMWVVRPRWDKPNGVFHAVIEVSKWGYVRTQGTNCMFPDDWYKADRTRYIVRKVIRIEGGAST